MKVTTKMLSRGHNVGNRSRYFSTTSNAIAESRARFKTLASRAATATNTNLYCPLGSASRLLWQAYGQVQGQNVAWPDRVHWPSARRVLGAFCFTMLSIGGDEDYHEIMAKDF